MALFPSRPRSYDGQAVAFAEVPREHLRLEAPTLAEEYLFGFRQYEAEGQLLGTDWAAHAGAPLLEFVSPLSAPMAAPIPSFR